MIYLLRGWDLGSSSFDSLDSSSFSRSFQDFSWEECCFRSIWFELSLVVRVALRYKLC